MTGKTMNLLRFHLRGFRNAEFARIMGRAELDGRVAHLYGLTEAEFAHIPGTFPLVAPEVRDAAMAAYRTRAAAGTAG